MRKHILIPTDFSENAWDALKYVTALYRKTQCTFYLLHAFKLSNLPSDTSSAHPPGDKGNNKERDASEQALLKLKKSLESIQDHRNHDVKLISANNTVVEAVNNAVDEHEISVIGMGTKGRDKTGNSLFGRNAVEVMEKVKKCPILFIPQRSTLPEGVLREIVLATTFKFPYKKEELHPLLEIANFYKAVIRVLHIPETAHLTKEQEKNKEMLNDYLKGLLFSFHTINNPSFIREIHSFVDERSSNLLVLFNNKLEYSPAVFSRLQVKEIDQEPQIPILILNEKQFISNSSNNTGK